MPSGISVTCRLNNARVGENDAIAFNDCSHFVTEASEREGETEETQEIVKHSPD